jgi:hypothetical protein
MTASLRYRTPLVLGFIGFGFGIMDCLMWVYVLYSREMADRDLRILLS